MGRASLKEERTAAILDAVGRCIARFGMESMTLEQIAAESGLSRSHVRHYAGNRADVIDLFRKRITARHTPPALSEAVEPGASATEFVLHYLFDQPADLDEYAAIDAIIAAARHNAVLHEEIQTIYAQVEAFITAAIIADHPDWEQRRIAETASQTLYLAYGYLTMVSVGLRSTQLGSARALVARILEVPGYEARS